MSRLAWLYVVPGIEPIASSIPGGHFTDKAMSPAPLTTFLLWVYLYDFYGQLSILLSVAYLFNISWQQERSDSSRAYSRREDT